MNKYYTDNRNIRDMFYSGELILEYDDNDEIESRTDKYKALSTMLHILELDLLSLHNNLEILIEFETKFKTTPEKLKIHNFLGYHFYNMVKIKIEEGFKFLHHGSSKKYLTLKDFTKLHSTARYNEQQHPTPSYARNFGYTAFYEMYNRYKDKIGWFFVDFPFINFPYKSQEQINNAIHSCKRRVDECKMLINEELESINNKI